MKKVRYFLTHLVIVISYFTFVSATCLAATYYVDNNQTSASDDNPGSQDLPWLTINKAAQTMLPGDTTYIRNGTYNEQVITVRSGTSTEGYITFSGYPGETPIIDGTGVTTGNNGIIIQHSYIKLKDLEVRNWIDNGIWAINSGYLEISDCEVHQVTYGIGFADGTHDFVLNRVEMHHFDLYGFDASPSGGADCYNGTFNDCVAHTGRDQTQNVDGFALGHGTQNNFVFNRCQVYDVFDGFDISSRNTTLNRCSAVDCRNSGFKIWQDNVKLLNCIGYNASVANVELDWDEEVGKTTLQNCTFVNAGAFNVWVENSGDSLDMFNCILAGGDAIGLAFEQMGTSNYQGDYNLFHIAAGARMIAVGYEDEFSLSDVESGSWTAYSGQDSHSVVVHEISEIFVNPANFDYHLLGTSSAVDTGTSTGAPAVDYDGDSRPQGAGYDIGAYEYVGWVTINGTVTYNGTPLCAMVLANGQYMFSCDPDGEYQLTVPLDGNGEITLFAFVDGLAPFKVTSEPSSLPSNIEMQLASSDSKTPTVTYTAAGSIDNPGWVEIEGSVSLDGTPLCAMVLANGQYMFSCDPDGEYQLSVPIDPNGEITLFVFVDGLQPYKEIISP